MKEKQNVLAQKKRSDVGVSLVATFLALLAAAALWDSRHFSPLGSIFPIVIGIALLLSSVFALIQAVRGKSSPTRGMPAEGLIRSVLLIGTIIIWIALLESLGFLASGLIFFVAIILITNRDPWSMRRIVMYAVGALITVYAFDLLFVEVLNVTLPRGRWL